MSVMTLEAIKYRGGKLEVLDQLLIPLETKYIEVKNTDDGWRVINSMQVRGAPAIAVVGTLSLAVELSSNSFESKEDLHDYIVKKLEFLKTSRPTAVNLANEAKKIIELSKLQAMESVSVQEMKSCLIRKIEEILKQDIEDNRNIGEHGGKSIIETAATSEVNILTHCNTGSLATAGYGTALGVVRYLHQNGHIGRVYCTETRPYMQGARLTAYELVYEKIPSTLICDDMVAALFKNNKISAVVVGADRVVSNGDTANKVGTYQIAILAKYHNVPFYVCAPLSTVDFSKESGEDIVVEERPETEMTHIFGKRIAAEGIACWNPAFDVTPASLITGIVTELGTFKPEELRSLKK